MSVDAILIFVLYFLYTFIRTKSGRVPIIFILTNKQPNKYLKDLKGAEIHINVCTIESILYTVA